MSAACSSHAYILASQRRLRMGNFVRICPLKQTYSHTRFRLSIRTKDAPTIYHRLLLFRINKPTVELGEDGDETCPHLGAPLSHAQMEDIEDSMAIVCPWHQYDFDLKDGSSSTGLKACVYEVQVRGEGKDAEIWVEAPRPVAEEGETAASDRDWELVDIRGVSEEFADPPIPSLASMSLSDPALEAGPSRRPNTLGTPVALPEDLPTSLLAFAHLVLATADPELKCLLTKEAVARMRAGKLKSIRPTKGEVQRLRENGGLLEQPPRNTDMVSPDKAPKRGKGATERSRILMLHALANIEQYAIDLAWDIIARFAEVEVGGERLPVEFFLDWAKVAEDEAKHFTLLSKRLIELGSYFGAHSVHAGLWESAVETAHSLQARIAIIHLVAEARGIDMNPLTMAKLQAAGDKESTRVLEIIHADEITHVTTGHRWFTWLCQKKGIDPIKTFREEVFANFHGKIKGPFNSEDRLKAGLTPAYYENLTGHGWNSDKTYQYNDVEKAPGDEHIHPRLK